MRDSRSLSPSLLGCVLTPASCVSSDFRGGRSGGSSSAPAYGESKKVFVGGLPPSVTEQDFRTYFAEFGRITDAVVMIDRDTQRSRGFGFVSFDEEVRTTIALLLSWGWMHHTDANHSTGRGGRSD